MPEHRSLVISLDGAAWDDLSPWLAQGRMPVLKRLASEGVSGELVGVLPAFTYPNWATFWTGELPSQHGILAFTEFDGRGPRRALVDAASLRQPTWLAQASEAGARVLSFNAPLSCPPRPLNGAVVAEQVMGRTAVTTAPPALAEELRAAVPAFQLPVSEQFFPAGGLRSAADIRAFVDRQIESLRGCAAAARWLLSRESWDAAVVRFFEPDPVQHALWHGVRTDHPAFDPAVHAELGRFFTELDAALGALLEAMPADRVLVFSEHGFTTCRKMLNIARTLADAGVIRLAASDRAWRRLWNARGAWRLVAGLDALRPGFKERVARPWTARGIWIDHKAVCFGGPSRRAAADAAIEALAGVADPDTGDAVVKKTWRIEELYGATPCDELEMLILEFERGYTGRTGDLSSERFWPCRPGRDYLVGTHTRSGLWCAAGAGLRSGAKLTAGIQDLPPTLVDWLGLPAPAWMAGRSLSEAMAAPAIRGHNTISL